jgi:hypothetical protein
MALRTIVRTSWGIEPLGERWRDIAMLSRLLEGDTRIGAEGDFLGAPVEGVLHVSVLSSRVMEKQVKSVSV